MIQHQITRPILAGILSDLAKQTSEQDLARQVAAYLVAERRTSELKSLMRDVKQYRGDNEGILEVVAISAFELSETTKSEIKQTILSKSPSAKKVIICERRDPDVIGGVRLELANRQLDLTIKQKLRRLMEQASTNRSGVI